MKDAQKENYHTWENVGIQEVWRNLVWWVCFYCGVIWFIIHSFRNKIYKLIFWCLMLLVIFLVLITVILQIKGNSIELWVNCWLIGSNSIFLIYRSVLFVDTNFSSTAELAKKILMKNDFGKLAKLLCQFHCKKNPDSCKCDKNS